MNVRELKNTIEKNTRDYVSCKRRLNALILLNFHIIYVHELFVQDMYWRSTTLSDLVIINVRL